MAFGGLLGTLTNNAVSITNPFDATGSVAVQVGDLIVAVLAEQTTLTNTACSDSLGNTYTAQNAGTDAGTSTGRMWYALVTIPGTLTFVRTTNTASADNAVAIAACYRGPFTNPPIDANPANATTDITSQFDGPATGTLSQASELVISWAVSTGSTAWTAAGSLVKDIETATAAILTARIGSQVVSATTTVTPGWTAGSNPTDDVMGTASFKQDLTMPPPKPLTELPPPPRFQHVQNRTWIQSGLAGRAVEAVYMPCVVDEWPLPMLPPRPDGTWVQVGANFMPAVVTQPPRVTDWPDPAGSQYPNELRTWLGRNAMQMPSPLTPPETVVWSLPQRSEIRSFSWLNTVVPQAPVTQPPAVAMWPNPLAVLSVGQTWLRAGLAYTVTAAAQPPPTIIWPLPYALAQPDRTWLHSSVSIPSQSFPVNQYDWPLPKVAAQSVRTWLWQAIQFMPAAVAYMPCVVTEWPLPTIAKQPDRTWFNPAITADVITYQVRDPYLAPKWQPTQPQRGWVQGTMPGMIATQPKPFAKTDWPLTPAAVRANDLRTWIWTAAAQLSTGSPRPLNQYDWPNPRPYLPTYGFGRPTTANFFPAAPRPFSQSDWPLTPVPARAQDLRTWLRAVINIPAATLPFNQFAWPSPRDYLRPIFIPPNSTPASFFPAADRPKNQYDWPLLQLPRYPVFIPPRRTHPAFIPAAALPRNQYDWPWPKGPRWPLFIPPRGGTALTIPSQPRPPNAAPEWPLPKGREYPLSLRSWNIRSAFLTPIVVIVPPEPEPPTPTIDPYPYTYPIRHELDSDYGINRVRYSRKIRGRI